MLTALILICSLQTTPDIRSCTRDNAVDAMWVPELFANPVMCFMHGQAVLAETSLGRASAPVPTLLGSTQPEPAQSR